MASLLQAISPTEELEITLSISFIRPYWKKSPWSVKKKKPPGHSMPTYQRKRRLPVVVCQDACNSWEAVVWEVHLISAWTFLPPILHPSLPPSLPPRQSLPGGAEGMLLELRSDGSFDHLHYLHPENISEYKLGAGASYLSKYPGSKRNRSLLIWKKASKTPPSQKVLVVFKATAGENRLKHGSNKCNQWLLNKSPFNSLWEKTIFQSL